MSYKEIFFTQRMADKIYETMSRNQAKLDREENFEICFCIIFDH